MRVHTHFQRWTKAGAICEFERCYFCEFERYYFLADAHGTHKNLCNVDHQTSTSKPSITATTATATAPTAPTAPTAAAASDAAVSVVHLQRK
jgi:hypothetical protein